MGFYEDYDEIHQLVTSGQLRPDEMNDEANLIYNLGTGNLKRHELNDKAISLLDTRYGGGPSFMGKMGYEFSSGLEEALGGIKQTPLYKIVTDPSKLNLRADPYGPVIDTAKAAWNMPMGVMRAAGAPASAAVDALYQNTPIPDNLATRLPLEIGAGLIQDAATFTPGMSLLRRAGILAPRAVKGIKTGLETIKAPASGIEYVPGQAAKEIDPLAEAAKGVHVPGLFERALKAIKPNKGDSVYLNTLRDLTQEAINKDTAVIPLKQRSEAAVFYAKTPEFRAYVEEVTDALRAEGYSDEAITAFLRSRAKFMVDPGHVPTAEEHARSQVVKEITKLSERNPELAEKLGVVYQPKEPLGPSPQADLFGRTETATPAHIQPTGKTTGTAYQQPYELPGQRRGAGVQLDWNSSPVLLEAEKAAKTATTAASIVSGKDIDFVVKSKDPGFTMKLHNMLRKSVMGLVTGPGTTARNIVQQAIRGGLEIPISAYEEILKGGSIQDAINSVGSQMGNLLDLDEGRRMVGFLSEAQQQRLAYKGITGDVRSGADLKSFGFVDKVIDPAFNKANFFNQRQEEYFWLKGFQSRINAWKSKVGGNVKDGDIPENVLTDAFNFANELTYSRDMTKSIQEGWEKALSIPGVGLLLQEAQPFARFNWGNALVDILDFSPVGFTHAIASGNADEAARIMGKSLVGGQILQEAMRQKEVPQGEWYEMNFPGIGKVDARRWHPLDAYALLAELTHRPLGTPNSRVTPADVAQVLAIGTRLDDTAIGALVGMFQGESTRSLARNMGQVAGSYLSRWTTPLKWAQGVQEVGTLATQGQLGPLGVQRDLNTEHFGFGGILDRPAANIPYLREQLPARVDPTTPNTPGINTGVEYTSKLFGLDPVQTNRLKEELKRLKFTGPQGKDTEEHLAEQLGLEEQRSITGELDVPKAGDFLQKLYARTGDPKINRALNEAMAKQGSQVLEAIIDSPAYNKLSDAQRGLLMDTLITGLKASFRQGQKAGASPYEAVQTWLKGQGPSFRRMLDEMARKNRGGYLK